VTRGLKLWWLIGWATVVAVPAIFVGAGFWINSLLPAHHNLGWLSQLLWTILLYLLTISGLVWLLRRVGQVPSALLGLASAFTFLYGGVLAWKTVDYVNLSLDSSRPTKLHARIVDQGRRGARKDRLYWQTMFRPVDESMDPFVITGKFLANDVVVGDIIEFQQHRGRLHISWLDDARSAGRLPVF
jgi:hypothetical protein